MSIEVGQLLIKSIVREKRGEGENVPEPRPDPEELKQDILAECRQMLAEMLEERRER